MTIMVSGKVHRKILVTAVASATLLGACASSSPSGDGDDPIRIGAVSSITGPAPFPEVPGAAQAVFDSVNAEGGIDGRMIEFISRDDGGDPGKANQQARSLADEQEVVAFVGGASLVDCNTNGGVYEDKDVISLMGAGVEPECFTSTHIAPVNNGTVQGYANLLYFASEHLDRTRVCPIILKSPGLTEPYLELIEQWEADTGSTAALVDTSINLGDDPTPVMLAIEKAECDAVVFNSNEPTAVAFMDAAKRQGVLESADWLTLAAAYTDSVLDTLTSQDTLGLYVNSEFVPLNDDSQALETWRDTLEDADVQRT
ncbi:MAG TPA: ABC transporter substrate-binding protein, partial [Beutenbergiaceae bacterium]|nr:ABC transporter substrate-binding protein [Beutenbergiaceae bacterium]